MNNVADPPHRRTGPDLGLLADAAHQRPPGGHQHVLHDAGAVGDRAVVHSGLDSQPVDLHGPPAVVGHVEQSRLDAGRGDSRACLVRDQGRERHAERAR
jgi:hypothetical protein